MIAETGSLTSILEKFLSIFKLGQQGVAIQAWNLLTTLAVIELILISLWWALTGQEALVALIRKILVIGFFVLVVQNYPVLLQSVVEGFIQTGKTASSVGGDALATIRDPSTIIDAGIVVALPMLDHLKSYSSWDVLSNLVDIFITGICCLGILAAYFIIAIQVFVTYLEFAIVSTLGLILIPFGVFKHTAFLAERVFGSIISFGIKLMVLGFLVSVTVPVLKQFTLPPDPTWTQLFNLVVVCFSVAALAWHAPGVAAGMLSGGPSLTAGTAASTGYAAAAASAGTLIMSSQGIRGSIGATADTTKYAAQNLGVGFAAGQVAVENGRVKGASVPSTVASAGIKIPSAVIGNVISPITTPLSNIPGSLKESFKSRQTNVSGYEAYSQSRKSQKGESSQSSQREEPSPDASEKTQTRRPPSKNSSGLQLLKKSIPPTAEPSSGVHVPLKTDEEPKI